MAVMSLPLKKSQNLKSVRNVDIIASVGDIGMSLDSLDDVSDSDEV